MNPPKKIFLIAGEASGDVLGASLMEDLRTISSSPLIFSGVGGPLMGEQGMTSLFPMTELSIMGLAEVLKHLPLLKRRLQQTIEAVLHENPDVLVTIDAPDFCLRVAKKIKKLRPSIKIIHYVAPTVWAWRAGRAKKIAKFLDGLLCLFPFEPPYFQKHGLKAEFVGHSLIRIVPHIDQAMKEAFCAHHQLDQSKPILCLLPGSRMREIDSLLSIFQGTVKRLQLLFPEMQFVLPTLSHVRDKLKPLENDVKIFVPQNVTEKYVAFGISTLALHASGTVALELALCKTPMVTLYRLNRLTGYVAKFLIKTKYANLVNILLRFPAVPELIQQKATIENATAAITHLLQNQAAYDVQKAQLAQVAEHLQENAPLSAARFVLEI